MTKLLPSLTIVAMLGSAAPALAHAHLTKATPAAGARVVAPKTVTIDFSEGVVPRFCTIAIRDAAGKPVKTGKPASGASAKELTVSVDDTLTPGRYTVTWRAVSVDSHRTQGSFGFEVAP